MFQAPFTKHAQIQSHTDSAGPASTRWLGLAAPLRYRPFPPFSGPACCWLGHPVTSHPSYRPGTQDEWGDISWGTSLLTEERLLNCLQGNRALALGKGCATSDGSEVLGKCMDLRVSGFSSQISSSHVSVSYCFSNKALILALRPTMAESLTSGTLLLLWLSPGPRA